MELVDDKGEGNITLSDPPQDGRADTEPKLSRKILNMSLNLSDDTLEGCAALQTSILNAERIPEDGELCDDIII